MSEVGADTLLEQSRSHSNSLLSPSRSRGTSTDFFYRLGSLSGSTLGMPLLERRRSTSASIFVDEHYSESPLHDLAPIAVPGMMSRVSRNNSVAISLVSMGDAFEPDCANIDTVMTVEGGDTVELAYASVVASLCAFQYGYNLGNMNTVCHLVSIPRPVGYDTALLPCCR